MFILINFISFLSIEQIKYLYEQAIYKKYDLLLVDNMDICIDESIEKKLIIDKDCCVIET